MSQSEQIEDFVEPHSPEHLGLHQIGRVEQEEIYANTNSPDPNVLATDMLKKRLDEAILSNNNLKKENGDLKNKLAQCLTPEQTLRLKNDNKRLLGLTERINTQRSAMEDRWKEKKLELTELEKELSAKKDELLSIAADRDKMKELFENVLLEVEKHKNEIAILKDGKSFADFVELKRQIKDLKEENAALNQGLKQTDRKGSIYFNLNDLATMLKLDKQDSISSRQQNQRVVVLDERNLDDSVRKDISLSGDYCPDGPSARLRCCRRESDSPTSPNSNRTHRPLTCRQSSVNRINFISPPRSLATSPRVFSRQSSRDLKGSGISKRFEDGPEFCRKTSAFAKMAFTKRIKRAIPIGYERGLDTEAVYRRSLGLHKKATKQQ